MKQFKSDSIFFAVLNFIGALFVLASILTDASAYMRGAGTIGTGTAMTLMMLLALLLSAVSMVVRGVFFINTEKEALLRSFFIMSIIVLVVSCSYNSYVMLSTGLGLISKLSMVFTSAVPAVFDVIFIVLGLVDSVNGHKLHTTMKAMAVANLVMAIFSAGRSFISTMSLLFVISDSMAASSELFRILASNLSSLLVSLIGAASFIWLYFFAECDYVHEDETE